MEYAIIDVGSNTIRLSVIAVNDGELRGLFNKKITAGLAGYVRDGEMSPEGIDVACGALLELKGLLDHLKIGQASVFATASLRNASNSAEAIAEITRRTGFEVDLLSGVDEAMMGYYGARTQISTPSGILFDIGGGSTEITYFNKDGAMLGRSFPLGSLNLFNRCVKRSFLPDKKERKAMSETIKDVFDKISISAFSKSEEIYAVGGSARASMLLANHALRLPKDNRTLTIDQLFALRDALTAEDRSAVDLILKHAPDRVHTIIPGLMILCAMSKRLGGKKVTVCTAGVREGYLWYRYIRSA